MMKYKKYIILGLGLIWTLNLCSQAKPLNDFSFDLYKEINHENENLFFSPLSVYLALSIALEGAKNDTKTEFEKAMHISDKNTHFDVLYLIQDIAAREDTLSFLNIANSLWIPKNYKIEQDFQNTIKEEEYSAEVREFDNTKLEEAAADINNWVSDKTNKLIEKIVTPDNLSSTSVLIANAIYFFGKWAKDFDENLTKPDDFYAITKEKQSIDFMNKTAFFKYYEKSNFQFVSIPYAGHDKSFCIILPKKKYGISKLDKKITRLNLENIFEKAYKKNINLSIPKFDLSTEYSLTEPLKELGIQKAFNQNANFSGITRNEKLQIGKVKHKAFITLDEKKTEAAAATIITITATSGGRYAKPISFKADHPFIFFIIDNQTQAIIFMGRYAKKG